MTFNKSPKILFALYAKGVKGSIVIIKLFQSNYILTFLLLAFACSNPLLANTKEDDLIAVKQQIDTAYYSFDNKLLENILAKTKLLKRQYTMSWLPDYYSGILCLQIGKILYVPNSDLANTYFEQALNYFEQASEKDTSAELLALISSTYGKLSSLSTLSAIYYGIKAKTKIIEADNLDKENSKVLLIAATHLMHTPKMFGGDKDWAEKLLKKALKIKTKHKANDKYLIDWAGKSEIYAYLAQLEILREHKTKAKEYINKALKLIPNYGFVKYDLARQMKDLK